MIYFRNPSTMKEDPEDIVLSHNDFLNGNILKLEDGKFLLIDFEYCTMNLRSYDIANFLSEALFDYSI